MTHQHSVHRRERERATRRGPHAPSARPPVQCVTPATFTVSVCIALPETQPALPAFGPALNVNKGEPATNSTLGIDFTADAGFRFMSTSSEYQLMVLFVRLVESHKP